MLFIPFPFTRVDIKLIPHCASLGLVRCSDRPVSTNRRPYALRLP